MTTASRRPLPVSNYRKPILWIGIAVIALFVLFTVEVPLFNSSSTHREHLLAQNIILIPHAVSGLAAFLIGPLQFSTRLRRRNPGLHRILGRAYVIAVFISVPSALLLGNALPSPLIIAADSQAILWFICTAAAFVTARNRHIAQHRVWMIRSYSVTLIFFTSRVLIPIHAYGNMSPTGIATSLFILQLSALMVPETALHWSALTTRKRNESADADHDRRSAPRAKTEFERAVSVNTNVFAVVGSCPGPTNRCSPRTGICPNAVRIRSDYTRFFNSLCRGGELQLG